MPSINSPGISYKYLMGDTRVDDELMVSKFNTTLPVPSCLTFALLLPALFVAEQTQLKIVVKKKNSKLTP